MAHQPGRFARQIGEWHASVDAGTTIVRDGLKLLAVFRDDGGGLHRCSAACPHLGGVVRWNAAEKSWDCPCHGSRFDARGKVVNGPANADLSAVEKPSD